MKDTLKTMTSRTMSTIVYIIVFIFVFCNLNVMTTETTPTQDHLKTSAENTSTDSEKTTLSPALDGINSTYTNTSTTATNAPDLSPTSTPAANTQRTLNVSGPSTTSAAATSPLLLSTTMPLTQPSATTESRTYIKPTSIKTNTIPATPSTPDSTPLTNETTLNATVITILSDTDKQSLKYSEIILTSIFSTILVIVVLVILAYSFKKCFRQRSQYSHHPLRETSLDPADRYSPPDDTLVISGGLYDAPRIYNPNMTVLEEEETQNDLASFSSRPGQFKLEFLPGDKDLDPSINRSLRRNV